ncbi:helix-turn-helix domain-containing protein [Dongshaea marina]|uniref:helix-turn-helix domain-containing protein n=1 Tax=Dongshaea marina TaxID=2047966 RepID=UPI000D3E6564|nr:helix-turn-helix transcriptional regulator [Dongshaea marina]
MAQTRQLITTLKHQLRLRGKTYQDVAGVLELSEASVKRLFSQQDMTLQRLERVCQLINLELSDLISEMQKERAQLSELTLKQEEQIVSDLGLLLVAVCVVNGYTFEQILEQYRLTEGELVQKLAQLDRLRIIELLPGNRIKLAISTQFRWQPNGPIQQFFQQQVKEEFFRCRFDQPTDCLLVANGLLSAASNGKLQQRMQQLANEFTALAQDDFSLAMDKKHGSTLVVAVRQWNSSLFSELQHQE